MESNYLCSECLERSLLQRPLLPLDGGHIQLAAREALPQGRDELLRGTPVREVLRNVQLQQLLEAIGPFLVGDQRDERLALVRPPRCRGMLRSATLSGNE